MNQFSTLLKTSQVLAKQYGKTEEYENLSKLLEHGKDKSLVLLVCGEFKSGKSSFVNAFLGEEICPVADGIATSAVSIIKYGKRGRRTVRPERGDWPGGYPEIRKRDCVGNRQHGLPGN